MKVFDECINIIDSLKITKKEAEAVEAVAQQIIPQETESVGIRNADIRFSDCGKIFQKIDPFSAKELLDTISPTLAGIDALKMKQNTSQIFPGLKLDTNINSEAFLNIIKPFTESIIRTSNLKKLWEVENVTAELDSPIYIHSTGDTLTVDEKNQIEELLPSEKKQIQDEEKVKLDSTKEE